VAQVGPVKIRQPREFKSTAQHNSHTFHREGATPLCYYHAKFGKGAQRCQSPCGWRKFPKN
jgi:hypothetical protein